MGKFIFLLNIQRLIVLHQQFLTIEFLEQTKNDLNTNLGINTLDYKYLFLNIRTTSICLGIPGLQVSV